MNRDKLTHERLNGLIDTLEAKGVLTKEESDSLQKVGHIGDGKKIAEAVRNGDPPLPVVAGGPNE